MISCEIFLKSSFVFLILNLVKEIRGDYFEPRLAQSLPEGCKGNLTGFVINEIKIECVSI